MIYRIADNILSPLGETTKQNYLAVKAGHSALCRYDHHWDIPEPFTASLFSEAQLKALHIDGLTRFEALAYNSAKKAIEAAGIDPSAENIVFILSTTKANIELIEGLPDDCTDIYPGTAASHIAQKLGVITQPITICNACISGISAIILAMRLLEAKCYDYAIVCGADTQNKFTVSGFQSLKATATDACRPFDIERLGLNLGEAAATLILKRDENEDKDGWYFTRGAVRNDGFHISSPSKTGEGARLVLEAITKDTEKTELAFINAHGTATMFNDQMESVAIERAGLNNIPVNALKGYFGHTLGAAGILETILSIAAADDHTILATKGFQEIGVSGKITLSAENMHTNKQNFVKMISGFGGCNGGILVEKSHTTTDSNISTGLTRLHHVQISPDTLRVDGKDVDCTGTGKARLTDIYKRYVNDYPKYYKMDGLCKLGFLATELLLKAEDDRCETPREDRAVILFNRTSSIEADKNYQASIQYADDYFPSPAAFVYTLPNIVTGEIAIRNNYHGETSFYILPEKNDKLINDILEASLGDSATQSIVGGWIDYQDDSHYEADLFIFGRKIK